MGLDFGFKVLPYYFGLFIGFNIDLGLLLFVGLLWFPVLFSCLLGCYVAYFCVVKFGLCMLMVELLVFVLLLFAPNFVFV